MGSRLLTSLAAPPAQRDIPALEARQGAITGLLRRQLPL